MSFLYCLLFLLLFTGAYSTVAKNTLTQVHVIFRHGHCAPDMLYPKDPNINDTEYTARLGQLTSYGKALMYRLGKDLRERYDKFLGNMYTEHVIDPLSTDMNRTKMSLEFVLAGLYPSQPDQVWNEFVHIDQPISYKSVSAKDRVMGFALYDCPRYASLFRKNEQEVFLKFLSANVDLVIHIAKNAGWFIQDFVGFFKIWDILNAEVQTGRLVSDWTWKVFPDFLEQAVNLFYKQMTDNNELRKYSGGYMLKKIIADARAKKDGILTPKGRKIFLYSGHEYNVAYILGALNVFVPHDPPYGSYVLIELHKINGVYGFKVLYHKDYINPNPPYLTIPGCDVFCSFAKFEKLLDANIPKEEDLCSNLNI